MATTELSAGTLPYFIIGNSLFDIGIQKQSRDGKRVLVDEDVAHSKRARTAKRWTCRAFWLCYGLSMASITLKDIPVDIHAQLVREAEANHRSLNGEALRRIELSFDLEAALNSRRDAQWIKEAIESGPEEALSRKKFEATVRIGLDRAASKTRVA